MPVSQHEVDELRRRGQAQSLDDADTTLQSVAENLGFLIHQLRHLGADQAEVLHDIELLVRAVELDRESIREARDILLRLGYGRDLGLLMTRLARKANAAEGNASMKPTLMTTLYTAIAVSMRRTNHWPTIARLTTESAL